MKTNLEWPIDDLARRVERALDIVEAAITLVSDLNADIDLGALEAPPDKVIAETAMFVRSATLVPAALAPGVAARAHELAQQLLPHARHPRVSIGVALHPALSLDYGAAHLVLSKIGYHDAGFDAALAASINSPLTEARERLPHRELEQAWLSSLAGGPVPGAEMISRTALVKGVDLLTGSRDDLYAFTHALLYASDFGNRDVELPQLGNETLAAARSAIAGSLDDDDFDLAGELLLTWPFLNAEWDSTSSLAFAVLANVEDQVGILPSLSLDKIAYEKHSPEARKQFVAAVAYHTAYVMGLLCAVMICRQSRPMTSLPLAAGSLSFAEKLLSQLSTHMPQPQWLRYIETLPGDRLASCSSFLLDVGLRRAVRRFDLAEVQRLLQTGIEHEIPMSPLCLQSAGILRRLSNFSSFMGG